MKKFNFYQDVKMVVWKRHHFTIEAENLEEAKKKAAEFADKDVSDSGLECSSEYIYKTEEMMLPEDNYGQRTIEVFQGIGGISDVLVAHNDIVHERRLSDIKWEEKIPED